MIELELYAPYASRGAILDLLLGGVSPPSSYSLEEEGARLALPSAVELATLLESSALYLWPDGCMYEMSCSGDQVVLFAMSEHANIVEHMASNISQLELYFAYACDSGERAHRNRISRKMDYGIHEAWVGRDFSKYLPGIYWITVIPVVEQQRLGLSVDSLKGVSREVSLVQNRNWLVKLYDSPDAWTREAQRIDAWCEGAPGVFRKSLAIEALAQARNFMDASEAIADWN